MSGDTAMESNAATRFRAGKLALSDNTRPLARVLLENYGLRGALGLVASDVLPDLLRRVDTARPVSLAVALPEGDADANRYVPSTFALLEAVSARLARELALPSSGFVDLGSGKGKALIGAARAPWRSVRGIELSARLHAIAGRNLARLGLAGRVSSEHGNAAALELAPHERVVYLFNPFTGATLERCLDRIVTAGRTAPRWIVYVNPTEHAAFRARFDLVEHGHVEPGHIELAFFRTRPTTATAAT